MEAQEIILCYRTDVWLSKGSRELIYIGTNKEECIEVLCALEDYPMTEEQASEILRNDQSQENKDYGWVFDYQNINQLCN